MKVLVACECSGTVRDAFLRKGHDAWSCDIKDTDNPGPHIKDDILNVLRNNWDLMIAHPPCTFLTNAGSRWLYDKRYPNRLEDRTRAVEFVFKLYNSEIPKIAIENPIGHLSTAFQKPNQIIHPFQFGHDASKATCLWLKNLLPLVPTEIVDVTYVTTSTGKRFSKWYWDTSKFKGEERQTVRSKTFEGIASAMADQWG